MDIITPSNVYSTVHTVETITDLSEIKTIICTQNTVVLNLPIDVLKNQTIIIQNYSRNPIAVNVGNSNPLIIQLNNALEITYFGIQPFNTFDLLKVNFMYSNLYSTFQNVPIPVLFYKGSFILSPTTSSPYVTGQVNDPKSNFVMNIVGLNNTSARINFNFPTIPNFISQKFIFIVYIQYNGSQSVGTESYRFNFAGGTPNFDQTSPLTSIGSLSNPNSGSEISSSSVTQQALSRCFQLTIPPSTSSPYIQLGTYRNGAESRIPGGGIGHVWALNINP